MKVERLNQKLRIMSYIGNFFDTYHHLQPVSMLYNFLGICASAHASFFESIIGIFWEMHLKYNSVKFYC